MVLAITTAGAEGSSSFGGVRGAELYSFQQEGRTLFNKRAILADDMGFGQNCSSANGRPRENPVAAPAARGFWDDATPLRRGQPDPDPDPREYLANTAARRGEGEPPRCALSRT